MSELISSPQGVFIGSILATILICIRQIFKIKGKAIKAEVEKDVANAAKEVAQSSLSDLVSEANKRRRRR